MKRSNSGEEKKESKKHRPVYIDSGTYKGQFEELFETENHFNSWDDDRDASWLLSLYYDCKAKKSMKCTINGEKIKAGQVIDLVLLYQQDNGGDRTHYYAFSKRYFDVDKETRKSIKGIKKMIKDDPEGGDGQVEDAIEELTSSKDSMVFEFNDGDDNEQSLDK